MIAETEHPQVTDGPGAKAPDQPIRKRRTFTLSDEAYECLSASAHAQGTNRSRLVETLILTEPVTVRLTPQAHELLMNSAAAFGAEPEKLAEELVHRCGAILTWQMPTQDKAPPWWMFWRKGQATGANASGATIPVLPAA